MTIDRKEAEQRVHKLSNQLLERRKTITPLNDYYRGKQPLKYASPQWSEFNARRFKDFSDNWCGVVANGPSERLNVIGFRLPGHDGSPRMSEAENLLWSAIWGRNDLDVQSSQGFLASIVAKRSYVIVWWDDEDQPNVTWEDPTQVIVDYDPSNPRRRRSALKLWTDEDRNLECATLYTDDEVWKFQRPAGLVINAEGTTTSSGLYVAGTAGLGYSSAGSWQPRQPASDDTWPLTHDFGDPPVVEFPNRPMLYGEPLSDIEGTAAMQDAINLLWAYLFAAADQASFPGRVIMGQDLPMMPVLDDNGVKIGEKPVDLQQLEAGRFLWLSGKDTKIDSWQPAKLDVFTNVIEVQVGHVAAQTRTPPHYLVTNKGLSNLSGDALTAAETGLVKKVEEQQLFYGASVREVFRLSALALDKPDLAVLASQGVVRWKDAQNRSEAQLADSLLKKRAAGYPFRYIVEQSGVPDTEVERIMQMREQELQSDPLLAGVIPKPPVPSGS